jgi:cobaltochelatase CobS
MAMTADLSRLSSKGVQALICKTCGKAFEWGDVIAGSRNRQSDNPYYKPRYWHINCRNPKSWQADDHAPVYGNIEETPINVPVNTNGKTESELEQSILKAVNNHFQPQLEDWAATQEQKIENATSGLDTAVKNAIDNVKARYEEQYQSELKRLQDEYNKRKPIEYVIKKDNEDDIRVKIGRQHKTFPELLKAMNDLEGDYRNVWLAGPAGSGKSTAAKQLAKVLFGTDDRFHYNGAIDSPYKLSGFVDANGRIVSTAFRKAWENGGVYLFDEVDASLPGALMAFNGALANGIADFPDGPMERHKDCYVVAAANTWGLGADAKYVGRAKLDAASLDRFFPIPWDYDEDLEREIANHDEWFEVVRKMRADAIRCGAEVVISPRSTYRGAMLLRKGWDKATVVKNEFGRWVNNPKWSQFGHHATAFVVS